MSEPVAILILAAGKGTRMKSDQAKVLHPLMGQPMLAHVLNAARYQAPERTVVVVGHQAEAVEAAFAGESVIFARQTEQLGTGHAVASAGEALAGFSGTVLILSGDVPLLSPQTLADFLTAHHRLEVRLSVLTVELPHAGAYGRIIRDADGYLERIVEARDASPEEAAVREINTGIYAVDAGRLFDAVGRLSRENDQNEYYLTDIVALFRGDGQPVSAVMGPDPDEVLGINDRVELARAVTILRSRINHAWMRAGVTMVDPASVYIETTVRLSRDVTIWPQAVLAGRAAIGAGVVIGPGCIIRDAAVGDGASIGAGSVVENTEIPAGKIVPPLSVYQGHTNPSER